MTKDEILEYATQSPQNTNRAVLSGMLDALVESEGGGVPGITTATVTFHMEDPLMYIWDGDCINIRDNELDYRIGGYDENDTIATVLLYNGNGKYYQPNGGGTIVSVSGNAEEDHGTVHITGDCTITIRGHYPD